MQNATRQWRSLANHTFVLIMAIPNYFRSPNWTKYNFRDVAAEQSEIPRLLPEILHQQIFPAIFSYAHFAARHHRLCPCWSKWGITTSQSHKHQFHHYRDRSVLRFNPLNAKSMGIGALFEQKWQRSMRHRDFMTGLPAPFYQMGYDSSPMEEKNRSGCVEFGGGSDQVRFFSQRLGEPQAARTPPLSAYQTFHIDSIWFLQPLNKPLHRSESPAFDFGAADESRMSIQRLTFCTSRCSIT